MVQDAMVFAVKSSGSTGLISNVATRETAGRWAVSRVANQHGRTTRQAPLASHRRPAADGDIDEE